MPATGLRRLFIAQKAAAKQRGIPFLLSLAEWQQIWEASGYLNQRGAKRGQYCMARLGDAGPYAIGNVEVISNSDNNGQKNRRMAKTTAKHVQEIRAAYIKGSRGKYSVGALSKQYGLAPTTIRDIVNRVIWKHLP